MKRNGKKNNNSNNPEDLNIIAIYLQEISKIPLLSAEEEKNLAERATLNDDEARKRLISANLRLVVNMAKKYYEKDKRLSFLDLVQAGNQGLIKAASRYDPYKGFRFTTFAAWWIKQSIAREMLNQSYTIRLPIHVQAEKRDLMKIVDKLATRLKRRPSIREIADASKKPPEDITRLLSSNKTLIYIDAEINNEENRSSISLKEYIPSQSYTPEELAVRAALRTTLSETLSQLRSREQYIIEQRFGLHGKKHKTLGSLGDEYSITKERVRQIEAIALKRLRRPPHSKKLRPFYDAA